MIEVGMNLVKNYYNLCLAIVDRADKDSKKKGCFGYVAKFIQRDGENFFNNSYVFKLCESYIRLYRDSFDKDLVFVLGTKEKQMISSKQEID